MVKTYFPNISVSLGGLNLGFMVVLMYLLFSLVLCYYLYSTSSNGSNSSSSVVLVVFILVVEFLLMNMSVNGLLGCNTQIKVGFILSVFFLISLKSILFIIISGSVSSVAVKSLFIIKLVPDLGMVLFLGVFYFLGGYCSLSLKNPISCFVYEHLNLISGLLIIYSLMGVVGFWMFWSMEASWFISCFMHTFGLISIGVFMFNVLSFYGCVGTYTTMYICSGVAIFSEVLFMILFLCSNNLKSSLGFFSASSICYSFLFIVVGGPTMGGVCFLLVSVLKISVFMLVESFKSKSVSMGVWMFMILVLVVSSLFTHFYMLPMLFQSFPGGVKYVAVLVSSFPYLISFLFYFIPMLESMCLFIHIISVLYSCKKVGYVSAFKYNVVMVEVCGVVMSLFWVFEVFSVCQIKFHKSFLIIYVLVFIMLFSIWVFFSDKVFEFEYSVSGSVLNLLDSLYYLFSEEISVDSDFFKVFNLVFSVSVESVKVVGVLLVVLLFMWVMFSMYYMSYFYGCKQEFVYFNGLFSKSILPICKYAVFLSSCSKAFKMASYGESLGALSYSLDPDGHYMFFNGLLSEASAWNSLPISSSENLGVSLFLSSMKVKVFDLSPEFFKSSNYSIYYYSMMAWFSGKMFILLSKSVVFMFHSWCDSMWNSMSSLNKKLSMYHVESFIKGKPSKIHLLDYFSKDYQSKVNSLGIHYSCSYYTWTFFSWCLLFSTGGFLDLGPYFKSSSEVPNLYDDELFSFSFGFLFEIFSVESFKDSKEVKNLGEMNKTMMSLVSFISGVLGTESSDGSLLFIEFPLFDDVGVQTCFFEKEYKQLVYKVHYSNIMSEAVSSVLFGDHDLESSWSSGNTEFSDYLPWLGWEGDMLVKPGAPTDSKNPFSMWSEDTLQKMKLLPTMDSLMWDFIPDWEKGVVYGCSEFVVDFVGSVPAEECDKLLVHPSSYVIHTASWFGSEYLLWGLFKVCNLFLGTSGSILSEELKAGSLSSEWFSTFYKYDESLKLPWFVYDEGLGPGEVGFWSSFFGGGGSYGE